MLEILDKPLTEKNKIGLSSEEAEKRLRENGKNALKQAEKHGAVKIFFNQFKDIMVIILLISTAISVFLGEIYDAVTIILIVLLNAILGFVQEYRTERTLEALEKMAAPTAKVWRDGILTTIPAEEIVAGDITELEAGDRVPADSYILYEKGLYADESLLTGESVPVKKTSGGSPDASALNNPSVLYGGTIITKGTCRAEVKAIGEATQMGKISGMISGIASEETPLQKRLGELGKIVAIICIAVCIIVFLAGVLRGEPVFDMLMTGITIAIAAIPEGLPAAVTIALALAVRRMLRKNALVHRLHAVETLGCASVICTDKTGTVTENKMTVTSIYSGGNTYSVTGSGYGYSGEILSDNQHINPTQDKPLHALLTSAALCNSAHITGKGYSARNRGSITGKGEWTVSGDPTEIALLIAAAKGGITAENAGAVKYDEIPFDSESRCMTVYLRKISGERIISVKGAPDVILKRCRYEMRRDGIHALGERRRREILSENDKMADEALRVLAFAEKSLTDSGDDGLTFTGLIGMIDPPRKEAKKAVSLCRRAHIKTVMITGDHVKTASAVARQAGIMHEGDIAVSGDELHKMSDTELESILPRTAVFARVDPADKLRIVRAFKNKGHIAAMTGDGVNDAPAVKEADIGVAMGESGTDVTRQAADVILLDDNFATLVNAVEQGRGIYANIRKFVRYLLSCNIGEVITMLVGILMGMPIVLLPTQVLLVNLVTDGLPAIALGVEPTDPQVMEEPPRKKNESFFSGGLLSKIIFRGIMIGLCTLGCFVLFLNIGAGLAVARTGALFTLVTSQLLHVFECKSEKKNIFTVPYFNNVKLIGAALFSLAIIFAAIYFPPLTLIFDTVPLTGEQLLYSFGFAGIIPLLSAIFSPLFSKKIPKNS